MSAQVNEEKKKSKEQGDREKVLALLDEGDKNVPSNPGSDTSPETDPDFIQLVNQALSGKDFKVGDVIPGKIIEIKPDFVVIDINYKSEGVIPKSEFRLHRGKEDIAVGQMVDVFIDRIEDESGIVVLSKDKADISKAWQDIIKATENDEIIQGTVITQVKGGIECGYWSSGFSSRKSD